VALKIEPEVTGIRQKTKKGRQTIYHYRQTARRTGSFSNQKKILWGKKKKKGWATPILGERDIDQQNASFENERGRRGKNPANPPRGGSRHPRQGKWGLNFPIEKRASVIGGRIPQGGTALKKRKNRKRTCRAKERKKKKKKGKRSFSRKQTKRGGKITNRH